MCTEDVTGDWVEQNDRRPKRAELAAVLFDMDGTLTDSERLWTVALDRVAAFYGGALSAEAREAMVGQDMWATIDLMHRELGIDVAPAATAKMLTQYTMDIFSEGLPFKPGASGDIGGRQGGRATNGSGHRHLPRVGHHRAGNVGY